MTDADTTTPRTIRTIGSIQDLYDWGEDTNVVHDCAVLSVDVPNHSFVIGGRILEDPPADPRDNFRRERDRFWAFQFTATKDGALELVNEPKFPSEVTSHPTEDGALFGMTFATPEGDLVALASEWRVTEAPEFSLAIEPWADPNSITFRGPGPFLAQALARALQTQNCPVRIYENWVGSGQSFGARLLNGVTTPRLIVDDEPLGGAWRIVPDGAEAEDARGVWLTGQSGHGNAYVTLARTPASDGALVTAVVAALAASPGLAWASTGNELVEDAEFRAKWIALGAYDDSDDDDETLDEDDSDEE